ncbi:MAG: TonB-dependent receptor [Bacteroidales bacterium]
MSARVVLGSVLLGGLVLAAPAALPAFAQSRATTADLSGVVLDQSRAVLPGASVTARERATGVEQSTVTGPDGRYTLRALPPGTYSVTTRLVGFDPKLYDNVTLVLGQTAILDFTLPIARSSHEVTVVAVPALATTGQTAVATVIFERQIETLPTAGRNFLWLSTITPGVTTDRTPQQGAAGTSGLTFAGQRARSNNIMVDGLDNNDIFMGAVRATFSQEAIQEFQVVANSFSAEFGKASGGIINVVTKRGGNTVAGSLFAYVRDDALNAKEHFEEFDPAGARIDQAKAPYRQYQFGGTIGGPIRRDRSFFFISAERLRVGANNFVNIDDTTPVMVAGRNYGTLVEVLRGAGFPIELGHVPYRVETDQILGSVDATLNPVHRVKVRFNWGTQLDENSEPWGGQVARSRGAYLESRDVMGAASLTSFFSSRTVNELRFQVADRTQNTISLDPTCAGICDQYDEGGPSLDVGDVKVGRQFMTPQPRRSRRYQLIDTLSRAVGHHTLKTGFDFSHIDVPSSALPRLFGGHYVFRPIPAMGLDANQALALGQPAAYLQGYGNPSLAGWVSDLSIFVEDEWRVRGSLTFKLGARYQKQFWPAKTAEVGDLSYGWPADNDNVAPRLAVSWNPFGSNKTSVHGAYGVFYDNLFYAIQGVPSIVNGSAEHVRMRTVPYPGSKTAWNVPGRRLPEPTTAYPIDLIAFDPRLTTPYAHQVSVGLERVLAGGLTLSADGVYVRGFDHVGAIEYNPRINGVRPVASLGSVWQFTSWADTWYRGLTLSLRKPFNGAFGFLAAYTLSKAEDMATDYAFSQPQDCGLGRNPADPLGLPVGFDPYLERARSVQDQRHRFVLSGQYALPAGLTVSGIITVASGRPFNIVAGADLNGDGDTVQSDRPRTNPVDAATSIGRNAGLLPATSTVDLRVAKRLALSGRANLDLIVEMFNVTNRTNYTQANAVFGSGVYPTEPLPGFGQFTKAGPPFQAQLAARVSF